MLQLATVDVQRRLCSGGERRVRLGTRQRESNGTKTGECVVCRGRFKLGRSHLVPSHSVAERLHEQPVYV